MHATRARLMPLIAAAVLLLITFSSAPVTAQETAPDTHKETVSRLVKEVYNAGNLDNVEEILAEDYVNHGYGSDDLTREQFIESIEALRAALPDFEAKIEVLLADTEWAASRLRFSGTFTNAWVFNSTTTIEPNGEPVEWTLNILHRLEDGLIVEDFTAFDRLGLLIQLDASPLPALLSTLLHTGSADPIVLDEVESEGLDEAHIEAFSHVINGALNEGDLSAIDRSMAEEYLAHEPFGNLTREQFKGVVETLRAIIPDLRVDIDAVVAEGDWLAARLIYLGTFSNPIDIGPISVPATQEPIRLIINVFVHFNADGVGFEDYKEYNRLGWLIQAGLLEG
ncbi:MAG: ester cyclase [Chloroflexi bacterium]|nr:ester cyclase [Chloroflexota bacterium]